jgi:hypothetical protein
MQSRRVHRGKETPPPVDCSDAAARFSVACVGASMFADAL